MVALDKDTGTERKGSNPMEGTADLISDGIDRVRGYAAYYKEFLESGRTDQEEQAKAEKAGFSSIYPHWRNAGITPENVTECADMAAETKQIISEYEQQAQAMSEVDLRQALEILNGELNAISPEGPRSSIVRDAGFQHSLKNKGMDYMKQRESAARISGKRDIIRRELGNKQRQAI